SSRCCSRVLLAGLRVGGAGQGGLERGAGGGGTGVWVADTTADVVLAADPPQSAAAAAVERADGRGGGCLTRARGHGVPPRAGLEDAPRCLRGRVAGNPRERDCGVSVGAVGQVAADEGDQAGVWPVGA